MLGRHTWLPLSGQAVSRDVSCFVHPDLGHRSLLQLQEERDATEMPPPLLADMAMVMTT